MNRFALDCSVAMAWCFEDEKNDYCDACLGALENEQAVVPAIWPLEVANALIMAHRRRRIAADQIAEFIGFVSTLNIVVEPPPTRDRLLEIASIGERWKLSAYDAAYLELAQRFGCPLAAQDGKLRRASIAAGVVAFAA